VISEFKNKNDEYVPTAWDSRHIVSLTGGKRFKKGWELGMRWLFSGGSPYTPYDIETSSLISNWNINGVGLLDYSRLNTEREASFHQLNVRLDKKLFLDKFNMNFYLDIQNLYGYKTKVAPILLVETDAAGAPVIDPNDPTRYKTKLIENIKNQLKSLMASEVKFAEIKAGDLMISSPDEELIIGSEVFTVDQDGNNIPLGDGDYTLDSGETITVVSGKVEAIAKTTEEVVEAGVEIEIEPEEEEEEETETESEDPKEEDMKTLAARVDKLEAMLEEMSKSNNKMAQDIFENTVLNNIKRYSSLLYYTPQIKISKSCLDFYLGNVENL
jgi:hypothetical protein